MNGVSSLVDPNQQPAATAPSGLATEDQIKKLYGDLLGRAPDAGGLQFYQTFNPEEAKARIIDSSEYRTRQIYNDLLGRAPDAGGLQFYKDFTPEEVKARIIDSPEYKTRQIGQIYNDLLGRAPDAGGLTFYQQRTPEETKTSILRSEEFAKRELPKFVGEDKQLSLDELYSFANKYSLTPDEAAKYTSTEATRPSIVTGLQQLELKQALPVYMANNNNSDYEALLSYKNDKNLSYDQLASLVGNKETAPKISNALKTYAELGSDFEERTRAKLALQVMQRMDLQNSSGAGWGALGKDDKNIPKLAYEIVDRLREGFREPGKYETQYIGQDENGAPIYQETYVPGEKKQLTDLSQIKPGTLDSGRIATTYAGEGKTVVEMKVGENGPTFSSWGGGTGFGGFWEGLGPIGQVAAMIAGAYALGPLIGTAGSGAGAGAVAGVEGVASQAAFSAAGAGAGTGLAGTLSSLGLPSLAANTLASGIGQGVLSGGITELAGGDFSKGFGSGFVSGAAGPLAAPAIGKLTEMGTAAGMPTMASQALAGGLFKGTASGLASELAGGEFSKGFGPGFVGGAAGPLAAPAVKELTKAGVPMDLAKAGVAGTIGGLGSLAAGKKFEEGALPAGVSSLVGAASKQVGFDKIPAPFRSVAEQGVTSALLNRPFNAEQALQNAAINYGLSTTKASNPQLTKAVNTALQFKKTYDMVQRLNAARLAAQRYGRKVTP